MHTTLLFERFISRERDEPPDIDVDFEHERREEVIQYIYTKYGTERCALAAALSHLPHARRGARHRQGARPGRAADRRVGALGALVRRPDRLALGLAEAGIDADAPVTQRWMALIATLHGFPRHLSQHSGGFVIAAGKLSRLERISGHDGVRDLICRIRDAFSHWTEHVDDIIIDGNKIVTRYVSTGVNGAIIDWCDGTKCVH